MSVKRIKDPAGLLGDRVTVDLTDPQPGDSRALETMLRNATPQARVDRLSRHSQLKDRFEDLNKRLAERGGSADNALLEDIATAESMALYLDAAPQVMRDRARQAGTRKRRRVDINLWISERLASHPAETVPEMWRSAPERITDQIGEHAFRKRVTACKKSAASK